ncbi:MAG: hypothetical protein AB8F95_15450 [Bacteroidia bacterium]
MMKPIISIVITLILFSSQSFSQVSEKTDSLIEKNIIETKRLIRSINHSTNNTLQNIDLLRKNLSDFYEIKAVNDSLKKKIDSLSIITSANQKELSGIANKKEPSWFCNKLLPPISAGILSGFITITIFFWGIRIEKTKDAARREEEKQKEQERREEEKTKDAARREEEKQKEQKRREEEKTKDAARREEEKQKEQERREEEKTKDAARREELQQKEKERREEERSWNLYYMKALLKEFQNDLKKQKRFLKEFNDSVIADPFEVPIMKFVPLKYTERTQSLLNQDKYFLNYVQQFGPSGETTKEYRNLAHIVDVMQKRVENYIPELSRVNEYDKNRKYEYESIHKDLVSQLKSSLKSADSELVRIIKSHMSSRTKTVDVKTVHHSFVVPLYNSIKKASSYSEREEVLSILVQLKEKYESIIYHNKENLGHFIDDLSTFSEMEENFSVCSKRIFEFQSKEN